MPKSSFLSKLNIIIRSALYSIFLPVVTIFYSFICVSFFPFPLRYRFALIITWTRTMVWVLKKICHVDYNIIGIEHLASGQNGIVLSNHQSTWETFFLPGLFYQPAIILKRELLWVPFFGWGLATINPIAINRKSGGSAMDQIIQKGKKCLDEGRNIIIFPEGTRITPGAPSKYRIGGARLATATGYPIIPVAHNAGYFWPKRSFIKKPGTITVVIGPPLESKGRRAEDLIAEAKTWITETCKTLSPPR